jgi:hypothetical protein
MDERDELSFSGEDGLYVQPYIELGRSLAGAYTCTLCLDKTWGPRRATDYLLASTLRLVDERLEHGLFCSNECLLTMAQECLGSAQLYAELHATMQESASRRIEPFHGTAVNREQHLLLARQQLSARELELAALEDALSFQRATRTDSTQTTVAQRLGIETSKLKRDFTKAN